MTVVFQLDGQEYGGTRTSDGGEEGPCGWLKDKYGLSWQVTPRILGEMLGDPDPKKSQRVMEAMLKMKKIDIAELKRAYEHAWPRAPGPRRMEIVFSRVTEVAAAIRGAGS